MNIFDYPDNLNLKLPIISIVVTNYNYSNYVTQCLKSISAQTYSNWECIIVDDCSTDNSVSLINDFICSKTADNQNYKLIQTPENGGQLKAIQLGHALAMGEFLVSIDADDMIYNTFLEKHLTYHLNSDTPLSFTCSNQIQVDENNTIIAGGINKFAAINKPVFVPPTELFGDWLWTSLSCAVFRKPMLDLIMPDITSDFKICADYYLFHFANVLGGSLLIPDFLVCYRRHCKNNFSSNKVISGLAKPGDISLEPNQDIVRNAMLSQINKLKINFYNYFGHQGFEEIIFNISIRSENIKQLRKDYFNLFSNQNPTPHHIEQDKDLLFRIYYSLPGRMAISCLKFLYKIKVSLFSPFSRNSNRKLKTRPV